MILSKRPSRHHVLAHLPKFSLIALACAAMIDAAPATHCEMAEVDGVEVCVFEIPAADLTDGLDPLDPALISDWF
ncbi:hypothetical protein ATO2_08555 [Roseovarius sp. 22II1-1F6A]|nr:hypothetical protein ATO2_08555 [Roseovarius sp. 22II1-1F6A]